MSLQIGKYLVTEWKGEGADFFIQNEDGEGMGVSVETLEDFISQLWDDF